MNKYEMACSIYGFACGLGFGYWFGCIDNPIWSLIPSLIGWWLGGIIFNKIHKN